jgi:hypothetical protein
MARESNDEGVVCGLGDPENQEQVTAIQDSFTEDMTGTTTGSFAPLTAAQKATASRVFGRSVNLERVFLSKFRGAENRPFTLAFALPGVLSLVIGLPSVYIINCGSFNPRSSVLIHELTHVWQSQHHTNPFQYVHNSLASQAQAVALNLSVGSSNPRFPFSPYAYIPGKAFSDYAAEQIAKQAEKGVAPIVAHIASVTSAPLPDTDNETGLATPRCESRTGAGVQF